MKTRKEWIDTLPEDIRERAHKHTYDFSTKLLKSTLFDAIACSFDWDETAEGHRFWHLVSKGKFDQARELLPKKEEVAETERTLANQESAEQIFDRIASNTMVNYNPSGFRSKYKTLFKTIILAINEARNQVTN